MATNPELSMSMFKGSIAALVTPFTDRGEVDLSAVDGLVDFHLENGTDGIVVAGTTGESAMLGQAEFSDLLVRVLQRFGGPLVALKAFFSNKAAGGLLSVLLMAVLVLEFGALLVLAMERGAEGANIETAEDAIWYVIVTMSTVGYGDHYPVTHAGRAIGSLIIIVGVGVFGTLTGFLANAFLSPTETVEAAKPPAVSSEDAGEEGVEPVEA